MVTNRSPGYKHKQRKPHHIHEDLFDYGPMSWSNENVNIFIRRNVGYGVTRNY